MLNPGRKLQVVRSNTVDNDTVIAQYLTLILSFPRCWPDISFVLLDIGVGNNVFVAQNSPRICKSKIIYLSWLWINHHGVIPKQKARNVRVGACIARQILISRVDFAMPSASNLFKAWPIYLHSIASLITKQPAHSRPCTIHSSSSPLPTSHTTPSSSPYSSHFPH